MKKAFYSSFAVSLLLLTSLGLAQTEAIDDFLGLETEIFPDLEGKQKFTGGHFHGEKSWNPGPENEVVPNKGQGYSIIPWSTQDPEEWLSIDNWLNERRMKDVTPDWEIRVRHSSLRELVGKILKCYGTCEIYSGSNKNTASHLSRLHEGDEVKTGKDSVVWIYMMDGSLLRLSSETSVSINEFNIGKSEIFVLARLNQGHIYWHPRTSNELIADFSPETDSASLPLMIREANQEIFERKIFQKQDEGAQFSEVMNLDDTAIRDQFVAINLLKKSNTPRMKLGTRVMVVSTNFTLVGRNASFDSLYIPGGSGYFKKRSTASNESLLLHTRGYSSDGITSIVDLNWYMVESNGRNFTPLSDVPGILQVTELLTKRIKTMELAREIWIKAFTLPLMDAAQDAKTLARDFGYSLWGEEIEKRFNFLVEYTRRIETTHLRSLENLLARLEGNGEKVRRELSEDHYRFSLNHYLLGLKSRYDNSKMAVREMDDLQYYVWILKNGKF